MCLSVSIRSYLPGFSSNYPAEWPACLACVAGGIQDRSVLPSCRNCAELLSRRGVSWGRG